MAVKVYGDGEFEYADGTGLVVRDNHLVVTVGHGISPEQQIAIYAEGKWDRAEIRK
jgi:hypothetical protein